MTLADQPTTVNPLDLKGAGQAGCITAPTTINKAILAALASLGIDHVDMPATPERVWRPCGAPRRRAGDQICSGRSP